jgi:predicted ABC-type ATPase
MINKLTGMEVSDDMKVVLDRLERDEYVSMDEIDKLLEIKLAHSCINNSVPTSQLKDREDLEGGVYDQLEKMGCANVDENGNTVYNGVIKKQKRLDLVIGLPASGKSSALVDKISNEFSSRIIDSDEAKKLLPEYNNGWGAAVVHEESKMIALTLTLTSINKGENIILPKVGSNYEELALDMKYYKNKGYQVYVHYVELSRNKALGRMLHRFLSQGRFLDPRLIEKYINQSEGNKIQNTYEKFKQEFMKGGNVDGYSKWNNDVKQGEEARLVEQCNCNGKITEQGESTENLDAHIRRHRSR